MQSPSQTAAQQAPQNAVAPPQEKVRQPGKTLGDVLAFVRDDSQHGPQRYLDAVKGQPGE